MKNNNKICGIIAEYNPFHNGHKYQLNLVKKNYDTIVIIMSGSFMQRGDVAIIDKWSRAKCALVSGADLVVELPAVYSMSTADRFAFGAINILNSLGAVNALSFGSECGDIIALQNAAHHLLNETSKQKETIQSLMKTGMPFAAARQKAFEKTIPGDILAMPNNILAVEYIKHIISSGSTIVPITHKREGSNYNSKCIHSPMASATAIRANLDSGFVKEQIPERAFDIFTNTPKHSLKNLDTAAVYHIRAYGPKALSLTPECTEGLENRIYDASRKFSTIDEIVDACSTKRYTKAKIRRIILSSMLGIDKSMPEEIPAYARVLGATEKGRSLLASIKDAARINIITKTADFKETNNMFDTDILSTDIWSLSAENSIVKQAGQDYLTSPIMI